MKTLLRSLFINGFALWIISQATSGISFTRGYETLLVTATVLGLFNLFIRPLVNILLLPINLLTLGAFRWLVNVLTLYLVSLIVPGFQISGFAFAGFSYQGILIAPFALSLIWAYVVISFLISFISGFLYWLVK